MHAPLLEEQLQTLLQKAIEQIPQALGGAVVPLGDLLQGDVDLGQGHGAHRFADRLFGVEEAVQVGAGDPHRLGDVGDRGLAVTVGAEQLVGELQYLVAPFVFRRAALPGRVVVRHGALPVLVGTLSNDVVRDVIFK